MNDNKPVEQLELAGWWWPVKIIQDLFLFVHTEEGKGGLLFSFFLSFFQS